MYIVFSLIAKWKFTMEEKNSCRGKKNTKGRLEKREKNS